MASVEAHGIGTWCADVASESSTVSFANRCRSCGAGNPSPWLDLGSAPFSNRYLDATTMREGEVWWPLALVSCTACGWVQTEVAPPREALFDASYTYQSGCARTWVQHAKRAAAALTLRYGLHSGSAVAEIASNDGTWLAMFAEAGMRCVGVEPCALPAAAARKRGLHVVDAFFGEELGHALAKRWGPADLIGANNVLAHVPDPMDFARGLAAWLGPTGAAVIEFPHLARLVDAGAFDTVYHEHYSYLSLRATRALLERAGLVVFDAEEVSTHGGSLRVHASRADGVARVVTSAVARIEREERPFDPTLSAPGAFQERANGIARGLVRALQVAAARGERVAAYGAAAKGNTLFNFAGVRSPAIEFTVDRNPLKVGQWLPGSRIPILPEAALRERRPDIVLLVPWNLTEELCEQLRYVREWGGRLARAVPTWEELP